MLANCLGVFNCSGLSGSDQEGSVDLLESRVWPCHLSLFPERRHRTGLPFFNPPCRSDHPTTPPTKHMTGHLPGCESGDSQPRPCFPSCFAQCGRSPAPPSFIPEAGALSHAHHCLTTVSLGRNVPVWCFSLSSTGRWGGKW